eukprot:TRINITY_DN6009_c0_g1_i1.p1 TRINITY_DN6009_c0_g1~~TRINITY_DN6009_c0_g1_i1.p1  ORF type:complete len:3366 (+),score=526.91 TRINITY_DN6009_c0_g1_i1:213-10310(+)
MDDYSLPADTITKAHPREENDSQNCHREIETNVFLNLAAAGNKESNDVVELPKLENEMLLQSRISQVTKEIRKIENLPMCSTEDAPNNNKTETEDNILLPHRHIRGSTSMQAAELSIASMIVLANSLGIETAFDAIITPLNSLLGSSPLLNPQPGTLFYEDGFLRSVVGFLFKCLQTKHVASALSLLVRLAFLRNSLKTLLEISIEIISTTDYDGVYDFGSVTSTVEESARDFLGRSSLIDVDIRTSPKQKHIRHDKDLISLATTSKDNITTTFAISKRALCNLTEDQTYLFQPDTSYTSITILDDQIYALSMRSDEWSLYRLEVTADKTVSEQKLKWPAGLHPTGTSWLHLTSCKNDIVVVVGENITMSQSQGVESQETRDLMLLIEDRLPDFNAVLELIHTNEVPFDLIVDDVRNQLEERQLGDHSEYLHAALRAASRTFGKKEVVPSINVYKLTLNEDEDYFDIVSECTLRVPPVVSPDIFEFEGGMSLSEGQKSPPALATSSPITFEAWVRFRSLHSCTLVFIGTQTTHFYVTVGTGSGPGNYVAGGWKGGVYSPTAVGRLDSRAALSEWVHIAVVHEVSSTKVFLNGEVTESIIISESDEGNRHADSLFLGRSGSNDLASVPRIPGNNIVLGYDLHGSMREVRIWTHARTQSEIISGMRETLPPDGRCSSMLWAHWPICEGVGIQLFDSGPHSINLKPLHDTPCKGGTWTPLPRDEELPINYYPAKIKKRPPLTAAFTAASVTAVEDRLCILQPFTHRQAASEFCLKTGLLISEKYAAIPHGPVALDQSTGDLWYVCNRMSVLNVAHSKKHFLPKTPLLTVPSGESKNASIGRYIIRTMALVSLLGHNFDITGTEDIFTHLTKLLHTATTEADVYACLVILASEARSLTTGCLRLPKRDIAITAEVRTTLLPKLSEVKHRFQSPTLPIFQLIKEATSTCIDLVYTTIEERNRALVDCIICHRDQILTSELAAHCIKPENAFILLRILVSDGESVLGRYIDAVVAKCVLFCTQSIEEQREPSSDENSILKHVAALQVAVVVHSKREGNLLLNKWITAIIPAATRCLQTAMNTVSSSNARLLIDFLKHSFLGMLIPDLLGSVSVADLCATESSALQNLLGKLRQEIREFYIRICSFNCEDTLDSFSSGIHNDVRVLSQYLTSDHPYRIDNCCSITIPTTAEFTLTFDSRSRLDQRDELVILYIDPDKRTTKIKTINDGLALAKIVINTSSMFVFARGTPRVGMFGGFGRGPSTSDSQRQKWGFALTAKASGRSPQFKIGWLCELVMLSLSVSCSIAKGNISLEQFESSEEGVLRCSTLAEMSPYSRLFTMGLIDPPNNSFPSVSDSDWSDVISRSGVLTIPSLDQVLRIVLSAVLHLAQCSSRDVPVAVLQKIFSLRPLMQSSSAASSSFAERSRLLLTSVAPTTLIDGSVEGFALSVISFITSDIPFSDVVSLISDHQRKAQCRLDGLCHVENLFKEVSKWGTADGQNDHAADTFLFTLQVTVSALTKGFGGKLYTEGIKWCGASMLSTVREKVQVIVRQLIDSAVALQNDTAKSLAQSLLTLSWDGEADFGFLANGIPAVDLLNKSSLKNSLRDSPTSTNHVHTPLGQQISPVMVKGEDIDSWHLLVEDNIATVRHDGRNTNAFLWNSHDVRKGKSIVHATKPWVFKNAPNHRTWYFEVKFLESSHRVAKGLAVGICIQQAPLVQYLTYKNSGAVKSHSVSTYLLPSYKLFDVVGCGVTVIDGTPFMFFTRNGDFFGLIEHVGPQTMLPCVLTKYASKIQFFFTPDNWVFDITKLKPVSKAGDRLSVRQQLFQRQAELQSWCILRNWAVTAASMVNDGATQLFTQCLTALREHTQDCLLIDTGYVWVQKHVIVILNSAKSASDKGTLSQFRNLLKITGWGSLLYRIIRQGIEGCPGGGKAAETAIQTLILLLPDLDPTDQLAVCTEEEMPDAEAFVFKKVCKAVDSDSCVSEADEEPQLDGNQVSTHPTVKLLLRGASELAPFLSAPDAEKKSVGSSCIHALRVFASNAVWAPVVEAPLIVFLSNCPRTATSLHHDLTYNSGKCVIAAFTALSVFGPTGSVGSRGTRCLLSSIYGTPQKCIVTSVSDGPVKVVLTDDPSHPQVEVSTDRLTPLRDHIKLRCKTAARCVADLCSSILAGTSLDINSDLLPCTTTSQDLESESTTTFRCPRKKLPKTCVMAALLHSSLVATQETLTDMSLLSSFPVHAVSTLSCRKLTMPATITELEQRKNVCISELEAGEWRSVRKESCNSVVQSPSNDELHGGGGGWSDIGRSNSVSNTAVNGEELAELAVVGHNPALRQELNRRDSWQSGNESSDTMVAGMGAGLPMTSSNFSQPATRITYAPPTDATDTSCDETSQSHDDHQPAELVHNLPPYEQQEFALEDENDTAIPSEEVFIRNKPISVLWTRCLTWYGALSAAAARCLLSKIKVAIAKSGSGQNLSMQELLAIIDASMLMESDDQESDSINLLIKTQDDAHTISLAVESLTGLSCQSENSAFATEPFNLIMMLIELLVKIHPTVLGSSGDVIHAFCSAIHVNAQQNHRIRLQRCFCNLVQQLTKTNSIIADDWSCLGVIRRRCEAKMSLLSQTQLCGIHHEVPMAAAELLYFVRKLLIMKGRDFDKEVPAIAGNENTEWCIGLLVDKLDDVDARRWHEAVVIAVSKTKVHVTCKGHPSIQDEWLDKNSLRLRKHTKSRHVTRQQFGNFNDVSNVLSNSRRIPVSHNNTRLAVCTSRGQDELTLAASNDIRTILAHSSGKSYIPRWYECTSLEGNMYTVIVDHMVAVDMQSAAISSLVFVGDSVDLHGIPFQLYQAIEHLCDCVTNGKSIPEVWGKNTLSDSVLRASPLKVIPQGILDSLRECYDKGIPEPTDKDIPPVPDRIWRAAVEHCEAVASTQETPDPVPVPTVFEGEQLDTDLSPYISIIHTFNYGLFLPCLPSMNQHPDECVVVDSINRLKQLLLKEVKACITARIINDSPLDSGDNPTTAPIQVRLDRQRSKRPGSGIRDSLLCQLHSQLDCYPASILAVGKPPFRVAFTGEAGIDQGGVFRDTLTALAAELMSGKSLFIHRDNGLFINTEFSSTYDHSMFRCVGRLMAVCIRSDDLLALDLHENIWKQLTRELVDPKEADSSFHKTLEWVLSTDASMGESEFADLGLTFTVPLGDGKTCELVENGREIPVTLANRQEYVRLATEYKVKEGYQQIESIRSGILDVLPVAVLNVLNSRELEEHVCGQHTVDVDQLIKHATYGRRLSVNSNVVENFWAALKSFSQSDLHSFLRFITGRPRLPLGKPVSILIDSIDEPKDGLPESHTCSSLICLPPYSSAESMKKQLLYGVRNCDTTDIA